MEKEVIAYVPRRSRIRLYKIAKAVKLTDKYKLVLVCEEGYYDRELFEGIFDEVIFYYPRRLYNSNKYFEFASKKFVFSLGLNNLIKILKQIRPNLIHSFCEPYDHIQKILKETNFPVIMTDGADFSGISSGVENIDSKTRMQERFCFENVDGIIHKAYEEEIDYYKRLGYKIGAKELSWFDHCDEDLFPKKRIPRLSDEDGKIHLVYTGLISDKPNRLYNNYLEFAREMDRQQIHFHIYANPYATRKNVKYYHLEKELEHFHLHNSLPYKQLIFEIAKYDWGLWWHPPTGEDRVSVHKEKLAIGNKLFSYMEAGLPVVVGKHSEIGKMIIDKYKMGWTDLESKDIPRFGEILKSFNKNSLDENVAKARYTLSIQSNNKKLINFYDELI